MMYDSDYDISYEDRILSMMRVLMENHTICMNIEYHKDHSNRLTLLIKIYDAKSKTSVFYSEWGYAHNLSELYYKTEKFMLNKLDIKYLSEVKTK